MDALSARRYSLELTEQTRKRKLSQPSVSHQQGEVRTDAPEIEQRTTI